MPVYDYYDLRNKEGPITVSRYRTTPLTNLGIKQEWIPEGCRLRAQKTPYVELLPEKELVASYNKSLNEMYRSYSVDLGFLQRSEKYLSRWSRENTPVDCENSYKRHVRRSFTPVRDVSGYKVVQDERLPLTPQRARTPIGMITTPYRTNINYYSENQPVRKYDVFQLRTWSYPIYKYIYGRDHEPNRPYSYTRSYATTPLYTPPTMSAECRSMTTRRGYSGYNYVAENANFNLATKPWSISNYRFWRSHVTSSPWYWSHYGIGRNATRHYNSYRPLPYTSRLSTYWAPYY
uniref:Uncharacterized protein n=1 Tax=Panagrolaimus sp. JU765 TaxID=591449 RepID=A0AC34Q2J5_9BILA